MMLRPSILIVEDDSTLRRGLVDNFTKQRFTVRTACDGDQAVRQACEDPADLILLDVMLPKVNGFEVCRRIRHCRIQSTIIMLTAKGQEQDIVRGLEIGADDYVTKPFSIVELLARCHAFLRRRQTSGEEEFSFGEFRLDLSSHRLLRGRQEVELTAKEFRLLEYFVKHAGRALTRDRILDEVWGDRVIVTRRSVDRCVTTLRRKIEDTPKRPRFVHTIRDVGYRFEDQPTNQDEPRHRGV